MFFSNPRFFSHSIEVGGLENPPKHAYVISYSHFSCNTVNSRFKKDLNLQIHLHMALFSDDRFLDSVHKSFLNQTSETTLELRKEHWSFLNRDFPVMYYLFLALSILKWFTTKQK